MFINYFGFLPWFLLISKNLCMNSWGFLRILPLLLMTEVVSPLLLLLTNHSISENTFLIFFCPAIFLTFVPHTWMTPFKCHTWSPPWCRSSLFIFAAPASLISSKCGRKLQNSHTPLHILLGLAFLEHLDNLSAGFLFMLMAEHTAEAAVLIMQIRGEKPISQVQWETTRLNSTNSILIFYPAIWYMVQI